MKRFFRFLGGVIYKIYFRARLRHMDSQWYFWNETGFSLFPPSFYYTHTEKEIEEITAKELAELKEMLRRYEEENGIEHPGDEKHK